jgi:transposase-like protein
VIDIVREDVSMTTPDHGPAVQRILLGANLQETREAVPLSITEATKILGWHSGKLSRIESGDGITNTDDLADLVKAYGASAELADQWRQLARDARRRLPPARVPSWAAKYVHLEAAAQELAMFAEASWPGPMQTKDYARAMLARAVTVPAADVDRMALDREKRGDVLATPGAPLVWLVVGEEALHRELGGRAVLRAQLEHVRDMAMVPHINVQVLPFSGGAHSAHGVPFTIVTLVAGRPGIVYLEFLDRSEYVGGDAVRVYARAFDELRSDALSPQATLDMLNRRIDQL